MVDPRFVFLLCSNRGRFFWTDVTVDYESTRHRSRGPWWAPFDWLLFFWGGDFETAWRDLAYDARRPSLGVTALDAIVARSGFCHDAVVQRNGAPPCAVLLPGVDGVAASTVRDTRALVLHAAEGVVQVGVPRLEPVLLDAVHLAYPHCDAAIVADREADIFEVVPVLHEFPPVDTDRGQVLLEVGLLTDHAPVVVHPLLEGGETVLREAGCQDRRDARLEVGEGSLQPLVVVAAHVDEQARGRVHPLDVGHSARSVSLAGHAIDAEQALRGGNLEVGGRLDDLRCQREREHGHVGQHVDVREEPVGLLADCLQLRERGCRDVVLERAVERVEEEVHPSSDPQVLDRRFSSPLRAADLVLGAAERVPDPNSPPCDLLKRDVVGLEESNGGCAQEEPPIGEHPHVCVDVAAQQAHFVRQLDQRVVLVLVVEVLVRELRVVAVVVAERSAGSVEPEERERLPGKRRPQLLVHRRTFRRFFVHPVPLYLRHF